MSALLRFVLLMVRSPRPTGPPCRSATLGPTDIPLNSTGCDHDDNHLKMTFIFI
jgi:hypothetical protein